MSATAAPSPTLSFARRPHGYAGAVLPRRADPASLQQLSGRTMGTTWSLRFDNPRMLPHAQVRAAVDDALGRVVAQMSHWESDSDISRFNRAPAGSRHRLGAEFAAVVRCALHWAQASGGALDPTVAPLVACWGFGPQAAAMAPDACALADAAAHVGWQRLGFDPDDASILQPGGMLLDLSGIAKGFAVDHGVEALRALGLRDLLFEIGGELRGVGRRPGGQPWQVRIDSDAHPAPPLPLADMAIATSGDRWHVREEAGRRWSHSIDPRSGQPVGPALSSVTVLHAHCMEADALATVLMVLGPDEGPRFAEAHRVAALFGRRGADGPEWHGTRAWKAHT